MGLFDDIMKKLRTGSAGAPVMQAPTNTPLSSGYGVDQAPQTTFMSDRYGSGSSNYVPPAGQSRSGPLAPTFQVPTDSPLSAAYNSLWNQNPASAPTGSAGNPYPAFGSAPAGQIQNPNVALPSPVSTPAAVPPTGLAAARNTDFFSDGKGGPTSTTLMGSGGLDRGGLESEARMRVANEDYENRINTLAARNIYQDVAGGGVGGRSRNRSGRDGNDRGSRRIWAGATPAKEAIDVRTSKAANSIRKDRQLLEAQSRGLSDINDIESERGAITNSEIDRRIRELEAMRQG